MKIVTTSNLGLTILLGCTLGMGAIGWYGSQRLADLLSYVLGAAWQTADGAMEGSIELGNQSLYIQKMLSGIPLDAPELQRAKEAASDALRRVEQGGLIDAAAITTLKQHEQTYQQEQAQLLTLYRTFTSTDEALRASSERMSRLSTRLEVIGDEAVESLTRSPDQAISWNGGLATRWQAADGGMEANIGFLRQLYALEKMQSEGPTPAIQAELAQATRFYQDAVDGMLATGQFDVPGDGEFAGQMLSTQYRALQADNARLIREWTTALSAYQNQLARYEHSADQLRLALVEVEAQGDATVEDQVHQLNAIIDYTRGLILGGLLLSLLIVTCCGFWLVRTIVRPLLQVDKRMQDIAAGEGDLNARINLSRDDEIGSLAGSVDRFIEKLQKMISATMDNNQHINQHVHTSVNRVQAISQSSRQTAAHAQALHHDSEQMVQVATTISDNCNLAAHNANEVRQLTTQSSQYVSFATFLSWVASKTDTDYREMVLRGQLNRKEIARECGFAKSVLLQNPRVKEALQTLEAQLRERDILPPVAEPATPAPTSNAPNPRAAADKARLKRLEAENAALRAEVMELRGRLDRYRLMDDVLSSTGRLPR